MDASNTSTRKSDWVLSAESFDLLLSRFAADRAAAAEQYELTRRKLIRFFTAKNVTEPEAAADETLDRVARRIAGGEDVQSVQSYALGVARFYLKEIFKKTAREENALRDGGYCPDDSFDSTEAAETRERLHRCFERCLGKLAGEDKNLILEFYRDDKSAKIERRRSLSESLGVSANAVRIRAHRIRARLETCINRCADGE